MENIPQWEGITIDFDCQFKVHLKDSRISMSVQVVEPQGEEKLPQWGKVLGNAEAVSFA